jgi:hypothetical protein
VNNSLLPGWGAALAGCEIACSVAVAFTRVLSELSYRRLAQSTGGLTQSRGRDKPRRATENSSVFVSVAWMSGTLARIELNGPRVTSAIKHQFMNNSMKNCSVPVSAVKVAKAIPL